MKFGRFMGAGYRNYFPEGAYNGFSCDNHGTFVMETIVILNIMEKLLLLMIIQLWLV